VAGLGSGGVAPLSIIGPGARDAFVPAVMEHIELAGIHSGDSACAIPPVTLPGRHIKTIEDFTLRIGRELKVCGVMNIQYAVRNDVVYILEVNPRASRTIPFVSKATGVPLAKLAAKVMVGRTLKELGFTHEVEVEHVSVKESVFPFNRFPGVDTVLGPEMKSTGEVMGVDYTFEAALAKALLAADLMPPVGGAILLSIADRDKPEALPIIKQLSSLGYKLYATEISYEKAVGAFLLAMAKVFSSFLFSMAARWLPTPIPMPSFSTAAAMAELILVAISTPPVMASTTMGAENLWLKLSEILRPSRK
jgi:hypothetical protein